MATLMQASAPCWNLTPARPTGRVTVVSEDLTVILGGAPTSSLPTSGVALVFTPSLGAAQASVRLLPVADLARDGSAQARQVTLALRSSAFQRLGGREPTEQDRIGYHVPAEIRAVGLAVASPGDYGGAAAEDAYRGAKALELLCETLRLKRENRLVPLSAVGAISLADASRLIAARELIEQRCCERLVLTAIARTCGLNRAKLTRGFRAMFGCTVADAIGEQRLRKAGRLLLTTDLPVSRIARESGFLSDAGFARAFRRRYGRSPSRYRSSGELPR